MALFYSKSTGGFYDDAIHQTMPDDVVSITVEAWQALLEAQSAGQVIQADSDGNPVAVAPPAPTADQLQAALVAAATVALQKSDIQIVRCYEASIDVPSVWVTYRAALRAIVNGRDTTSTVLPTIPAYPS